MREGWTRLELREVLTRDEDRVPVDAGRLYAGLGVLRDGQGLFVKDPFVGGETSYGSLTRVRSGQVVLRTITAWESPIGVVTDEQDGGFVSPSVFPAFTVDRARLDPRFMALLCQSPRFWAEMRIRTTGTVLRRQTLSAEGLLSIPVNLPPLDEQRRIVDLIGSLDATIAATDHAVAKAEQARRAVLTDLLAPQCVATQSAMADGSTRPAMREGWTHGALDDLAAYLNGRAFKPGDFTPSGLPVIRIKQFLDSGAEVDHFDGEGRPEHLVDDGDIIFSWSGTLAVGVWDRGPAWVNQHLFKVEPKAGINRRWLPLAIEHCIPELNRRTHGSTMRHITRSELRAVRIGIPPLDEQRRIAGIISTLDDEVVATKATARTARTMRAGLLSDLLSGNHEIPPTYDRLLEAA